MQLGDWELTTVSGGRFRIDGGTMFGVVPKPLWAPRLPPDENNTIAQQTNCVLARNQRHVVLIDTGYGSKLTARKRAWLGAEDGDPLSASLRAAGVGVEEITTVVLSHLHFDHAGGATCRGPDGQLRATFPNAEYVAAQAEWDAALSGVAELRGAYPLENLTPLAESGQLRLIDGEVEIVPGVQAWPTPGHTLGHQSLVIESGGQGAIYLGDLCPTWRHLPPLWCMAYDVDLLETRRTKSRVLGVVADQDLLALADHDPDHAAARIQRDRSREFALRQCWKTLQEMGTAGDG